MRDIPPALAVTAAAQCLVVSRRQLLAAGCRASTIDYRAEVSGRWQILLPRVYGLFTGTPTAAQRQWAALLFAADGRPERPGFVVMLGAETAATMHGLRQLPTTDAVHVLAGHSLRPRSTGFVVVRRTRRLPTAAWRRGMPIAPVERAVIDTCRRMTRLRDVRALVAEAVQSGRTTAPRLADEIAAGESAGSARARRVVDEVLGGARSAPEAHVLAGIRAAGLPQPRWNADLCTSDGRWLARPDAWWEDANTVLEIDSAEWHLLPEHWARTLDRHARMTACGLLVVHVTPAQAYADLPALLDRLAETLAHCRTLPPARVRVAYSAALPPSA